MNIYSILEMAVFLIFSFLKVNVTFKASNGCELNGLHSALHLAIPVITYQDHFILGVQ